MNLAPNCHQGVTRVAKGCQRCIVETLLYLLRQLAGLAPVIPLDDLGRPR
jgi:hypothetical protein